MLRPPQVLLPAADASQRRGPGSGPPAGPCSHHPEVTAGQGMSDLGTLSPVGPRLWVTPPGEEPGPAEDKGGAERAAEEPVPPSYRGGCRQHARRSRSS